MDEQTTFNFSYNDRVKLLRGTKNYTVKGYFGNGEYRIERANPANPALTISRMVNENEIVLVKKAADRSIRRIREVK